MEFSVEFYQSRSGQRPVLQFLTDLKASDPKDHAAVMRGLDKLRNRDFHREPLCKTLGDGLCELRHVGKLNVRIIWFYVKGQKIIVVHGVRNKAQAFLSQDLEIAKERMLDWIIRRKS